jgi:hypothetical protein
MQRFELRYVAGNGSLTATESLDVPDIVTALVVADIVATQGTAEIWSGEKRLAGLSRKSDGPRPLWQID